MITCIFGLTACGSEETYTDYEQRKMDTAIQIATQYVIPSLENFEDEATLESFSEYTADEVAYLVQENVGITVDGYHTRLLSSLSIPRRKPSAVSLLSVMQMLPSMMIRSLYM